MRDVAGVRSLVQNAVGVQPPAGFSGVTATCFDGLTCADAHSQAYEWAARARLRETTDELLNMPADAAAL